MNFYTGLRQLLKIKNSWHFIMLMALFVNISSCGLKNDDQRPFGSNSTPEGSNTTTDDPYYSYQWHLKNSGQLGGTSGEDINVEDVWREGNKGEGVLISVVDNGMEVAHPDLSDNVLNGMSYNYSNGSTDPSTIDANGPASDHGTCVAGIIAARDSNSLGVKGVASRALIVGYNLIASGNSTEINIADALTRNVQNVSVSNNSWGYQDGTGHFTPLIGAMKSSIETGISTGRGGNGTVYVWAAGNGAGMSDPDMSNYDGLTNHHAVMAVCAVDDKGKRAPYSEKGANLWVCGPSMGNSLVGVATTDLMSGAYGINKNANTTDLSDKDYTTKFNGTSAAAPVVSGVAALVIKANPNLSWRDVKLVLAKSARKNDPTSTGWVQNAVGIPFHLSYGFGAVDAQQAVTLAATWSPVGPMQTFQKVEDVFTAIADGTTSTSSVDIVGSGISKIEFVELTVEIVHGDWGELEIELSRTGVSTTVSPLSLHHDCYNPTTLANEDCAVQSTRPNHWMFGSSNYLDEPADGTWIMSVKEKSAGTAGGNWNAWMIKIYGR